ncbi:hypothetical protein DPX16_23248 [Anabarilius grahami]|uniref:Uncharacterized protein n=1 Tax=Anabarilius grahami TaxID=495550 RepID=A0A3N0XF20_ANAGA|nr:hypothetical protein DPX16_23248 [Anabarilius grahami]
MVGDRIKDPCENEVWQIILQLREIVELICAPVITEGQAKEAVWSYLPDLPDDLLTTMLDELGVESIEDLTLVEERDLVKYLKPIQSRKLMKGIKDVILTLAVRFCRKCHNGDMFSNHPTHIFRSNPKSFGDIGKHGDTAGDGCHSLLQQVKMRVEYKNRNNTLAQRRRQRRPHTGMAGEARLARGPVDQYGCVRWGPADLPEGETEATLENKKRDLLNIYSGMPSTVFLEEGMSGAERAEPMMEKTYVILRKYLNKVPAAAMSEIKQEWPFLFSQKCLFSHFGLLTDVDVLQKLQEAISRRGQTILDYCATLDNPKIRDVLACYDPDSDKSLDPAAPNVPCATAVDVNTAELPGTPCLIIQGDMMKPSGWLISIEGHVVMGPHPFVLHGVAAFFSSYYVFNLEYPAA